MRNIIVCAFLSLAMNPGAVSAQSKPLPPSAATAIDALDYLLSVDRLEFYTQNLADFLDGKKPAELVTILRGLTPEDIHAMRLNAATLKDPSQWQAVIHKALQKKHPGIVIDGNDLAWGYNFFKNKLVEGFSVKAEKPTATPEFVSVRAESKSTARSVPKIKGYKSLLDTERYIAEKTTRAIHWDAIVNNRGFDFYVGTQAEVLELFERNDIQIVTEVKPLARNYNKIYLTYDPRTKAYAYAFTLLSGDDRIQHLMAQLRVVKFQNKNYIGAAREKIRIFGNVSELHYRQEQALLKIYQALPLADKVVIGQKGAIESAIADAGMLEVLQAQGPEFTKHLKLTASQSTKFATLMEKAKNHGAFQLESMSNSSVKIDKAYAKVADGIVRDFQQFESEQPSHDFADYLLQDKNGNIQRWRLISAMWGDEIVPIAAALKKSGHKNIVYIGTAGALAGKGMVVGDVVRGGAVRTHSGKQLSFTKGALAPEARDVVVGQVHTPFEETDEWLRRNKNQMDIVEVETGYLREILGEQVRLEAYFLVSDIVGSETETLAHAAQSSGKRKRGQIRLLENLFAMNGIVAPIANFEPLSNTPNLESVLHRLKVLRPSRDIFSLLQVAHVAVLAGKTSQADLEAQLKAQPAFDRKPWNFAMKTLGEMLALIQSKLPKGEKVGIVSEPLFNGTFNPKTVSALQITTSMPLSSNEIVKLIGESSWKEFSDSLKKTFKLEAVSKDAPGISKVQFLTAENSESLTRVIEAEVLQRAGFIQEVDDSGKFRIIDVPGLNPRGLQCKSLF